MSLASPWLLLAFPCFAFALWLLERWRRRPLALRVADLALFQREAASETEARAARRRLALSLWLRLLALALLTLGWAEPRLASGPGGALAVDLVCDRGLSSGASARSGASALETHRAELRRVLARLRPDDRVRLHLLPGEPLRDLDPAAAAAALDQARPAGREAELEATLQPLLARGAGPPVFLASDRAPTLTSPRLALALFGAPYLNRGITSLRREGAQVFAAVRGAPGPVEVQFAASSGAGAPLLTGVVRGQLGPEGFLLVAWSEPRLAQSREVSARLALHPGDALATDDVAFALAPPAPSRRVGIVGEVSPALERALRALPGVALERLSEVSGRPEDLLGFDLLVVERLPEVLPQVPLAVVPRALPPQTLAGGPLAAGLPHPAFVHSLARLGRDAGGVERVAAPPPGLPQGRALLLAGAQPLILVSGAPRPRVLVCTAPAEGPWTRREVFPLLWAELLQSLAPAEPEDFAALPAGARVGPGRAPWGPPQRVVDGARSYGTAAGLAEPPPQAVSSAFSDAAFAALEAARPAPPARGLASYLALGAGLFLLLSFWPAAGRGPSDEGGDSRPR